MKKIKPRIYLLMENKKRELDSRIYFALKASLSNFSTVIAAKPKIFDNRNRIRKGIIIFKSIGINNLKQIKEYKKLGFVVGSLDEEGMMFFSREEYTERIHPPCLENLDIFFCWGENDYQALIKKFPAQKNKIYKIGNTRIDILKKPLSQKYFIEAETIREKHGEFFLVNTMFTKANNMQLIMDKQDYIESLIKNGHKPDSLKVKYARPYLKFQKENLELIKNFLSSFSNNNPNKKIIIRPHPGEYSETWINFSKDKKNIEVIIDDKSTCSWIIAAKKCISSNCTTSVEGYLLNKISANYKVYEDEKVEFKLPKLMSCNIKNDGELINYLNDKNDFNIDKSHVDDLARQSIHNFEKDQCSVKYFIDSLNSNLYVKNKLYAFDSKDKFSGFLSSIFLNIYYYIRFLYRKIFTKQNKTLSILLKKKFASIDKNEISETLNEYQKQLNIKEKIRISKIYPQVYSIEKE